MDLEAFRKATPHGRASELAALPPAKAVELLRGLKAMDRPDSLLLLEEVQRNRVILLSEPHTQAAIMTAWSNSALLLSKKAATKALEKIVEAGHAARSRHALRGCLPKSESEPSPGRSESALLAERSRRFREALQRHHAYATI